MLVQLDAAVPQAEVQQARANLTLAKTKYDRAVDLAKSNFISGQAKDEADNNLRISEASLQLAEAKLAKMEIRAPFAGIIGLRIVSLGDYVKEGADLVNLESIDPLKVDFRVPEMFMRQVQVGQTLEVALDALPGKTFEGRVLAVNPLIDAAGSSSGGPRGRTESDTSLRPGMFRARAADHARLEGVAGTSGAGAGAARRPAVRVSRSSTIARCAPRSTSGSGAMPRSKWSPA
jgi:membrane fusion protein (multidrug efflux system)